MQQLQLRPDEERVFEAEHPEVLVLACGAIAREVLAVADELGATPSQVAIAWVRAQPWHAVPIVGARSEAQLRQNLGALELVLSPDQLERLESAGGFGLGFPRDFLESDDVRALIFGETFDLIDDPRAPRRQSVPAVA